MQIMPRLVLVHGSTLRKEKKRPEKSYGLLGLRCGPVTIGNNPLHPGNFPLSYSDRLLSSLRSMPTWNNYDSCVFGNCVGTYESFSSLRDRVAHQGSRPSAWRCISRHGARHAAEVGTEKLSGPVLSNILPLFARLVKIVTTLQSTTASPICPHWSTHHAHSTILHPL